MWQKLVPSSLDYLRLRLGSLVSNGLLSNEESELVFNQSPFHKQGKSRSSMLWSTTTPLSFDDSGVSPLLESWGGESVQQRVKSCILQLFDLLLSNDTQHSLQFDP